MSTMDSAVLADEALDRLKRRHSGEMYDCVACYRHEPCPERELIRQYDRLLADYGKRLSVAESFERDSARLRRLLTKAMIYVPCAGPSMDPCVRCQITRTLTGVSRHIYPDGSSGETPYRAGSPAQTGA